MGRDVTLYPKKASRMELSDYLESLGFTKCGHFWDWPKGTLNYSWFDRQDFKSIDGVSADIYPVSAEEQNITKNEWALHVRNLYGASWYDVAMLNEVLRGARKQFGGTIKGDYGTNKYAPLWNDKSTPISRGISGVYQHVKQELSAVKYALPEPSINHPQPTGGKIDDFLEFTKSSDPSRVIYNGLVPFAVAMFEYFFSQAFQVLIAYDKLALEKRENHKAKFEFSAILDIHRNKRSIEELIAENYTFQNLDQLNKAYKDWLDIDVRKIFFQKKRIGKSITFLENRISEIIQYRHGIVHHFVIDKSLTRDAYIHILDAISLAIEEFVLFVDRKYKIEIDRT
jgi:RiboL-PSP-HEPN